MKNNFAALVLTLASSSFLFAQDGRKGYEPISFEKGSKNVVPFTNREKKFNDWSLSFGVGVPLVQSADMTSIKNGNGQTNIGHSYYVSLEKAITHAFGLNLQYDGGETRQSTSTEVYKAKTRFSMISLLGDINFSGLFRRVDNKSPYRWALHGYAGIAALGYKALRQGPGESSYGVQSVVNLGIGSLAAQAGAGVKYKLNRRLDLGLRVMYVYTGDEQFDGGGEPYSPINMIEDQNSDNFFNVSLGLTCKVGKHATHLMWYDPLQEIYHKLDNMEIADLEVCKSGDKDNDGVCDDWDRQLDTPEGARVDGAGVALDTDLDGVIDLYDKCVTIPGLVSNQGCPLEDNIGQGHGGRQDKGDTEQGQGNGQGHGSTAKDDAIGRGNRVEISRDVKSALRDLYFVFDKTQIVPESLPKLDQAAEYIKASNNGTFVLTGHTDKSGNSKYNLKLSRRRAKAVVTELEKRGVNASQLKSKGVGEKHATVPANASDVERRADRKVTIEHVSGTEWDALPKSDVK